MSFRRASASNVGTSPCGELPASGEASAAWAVFGLFFGAGRALGSVLLPGASPCGELPEAEAEAVAEVPSSCEEPIPLPHSVPSRGGDRRDPSREVACSGTSGTWAQCSHTTEPRHYL